MTNLIKTLFQAGRQTGLEIKEIEKQIQQQKKHSSYYERKNLETDEIVTILKIPSIYMKNLKNQYNSKPQLY